MNWAIVFEWEQEVQSISRKKIKHCLLRPARPFASFEEGIETKKNIQFKTASVVVSPQEFSDFCNFIWHFYHTKVSASSSSASKFQCWVFPSNGCRNRAERERKKNQTRRKNWTRFMRTKSPAMLRVLPYLSNFLFRFISTFIFVILLPKTNF